eukprot:XP_028355825.1 putative uncharacterized protein FLJ43944 [Physeter catodon]
MLNLLQFSREPQLNLKSFLRKLNLLQASRRAKLSIQSPEWVGPSPVQHQHPTQLPGASTDGAAQTSVHNEVTFSPLGPGEVEHAVLPNVTIKPVDLVGVLTLEPTKEVEHPPVQQGDPTHTPDLPGGIELSLVQEEAPAQSPVPQGGSAISPEPPKEVVPSPTQQELKAQSSQLPEKVEAFPVPQGTLPQLLQPPENMESSPVQQEFPDVSLEPLKEKEPSPAQQEAPSQPPAPPKKVAAQPPVHYEMTVPTLGQDQAQHSNLPSSTVKPLDQGLPTAPEPKTEAEHSAAL